ncbi:MAG TPA: FAD binding domain-containing protein [Myxococcota bacterium]|nr:FAD binding domain-containing protein [Myxococcota bacterium]HRY96884.1 FAD binding domain-containing protein [Myxococcota bacterium]HSA22273.1 FAD binding domain-containing protein [Myxococcota bacterium]
MIPNAKTCLYPKDPPQAVSLLQEHGKRALILAGGTTAALSHDPEVEVLIDISRMGCDAIEPQGGGWRVGCNVRLQRIASHAGLAGLWGGVLSQAAAAVGSRPIRNAVTLGGNLVQIFRWSDTPVALLAMGARLELLGPRGPRSVGADEFYARHPRQVLEPAELLVAVQAASPVGKAGGAFIKYARTAVDLAVADAAACLRVEGGRCVEARLAIGATRALPWRASEAEALLTGQALTPARLGEAAALARKACKPVGDARTDKAYRERMVEVVARRALERAVANLQERA